MPALSVSWPQWQVPGQPAAYLRSSTTAFTSALGPAYMQLGHVSSPLPHLGPADSHLELSNAREVPALVQWMRWVLELTVGPQP